MKQSHAAAISQILSVLFYLATGLAIGSFALHEDARVVALPASVLFCRVLLSALFPIFRGTTPRP